MGLSVADADRGLPVVALELLVGVGHRAPPTALDRVLRRVVGDGDAHGPDAADAELLALVGDGDPPGPDAADAQLLALVGQRGAGDDRALLVGHGDRHAGSDVVVAP